MRKVTPISQPIDENIKEREGQKERARHILGLLQGERQNYLNIIDDHKRFSPDEREAAKEEVKKIEEMINEAQEIIQIGNMMLSEQLERKMRLSGQTPKEVKIR